MTCQGDHARLGDYVDGTLTADEAASVEAHVAACRPCRALAADLRTIRSMARSLDQLVPPPHVWRAIAAAADRPSRWSALRALVAAWQPAAATAMAAVIAAGLWWLGNRLSTDESAARSAVASGPAGVSYGPHPAAEARYTTTIARLEALASAERATLDPSLVDVIDSGMDVIDTAIDQSRAAVQANPDSEAAQDSLYQALRTKVTLLQDTLALANDRSVSEQRRQGVAGDSEQRRQGVAGDSEQRRQGVAAEREMIEP